MANLRVAPKSIPPEAEPDGSHIVTVSVPGSGDIDVVFSKDEAVLLLRTVQAAALSQYDRPDQQHVEYPYFQVVRADVAHGQQRSSLLVETAEIGSVVLTFNDSVAENLKGEIDRVTEINKDRASPN